MTPNEINVAIAEACGWKNVHWYDGDNSGPGFWSGIPPLSEEDVFKLPISVVEHLRKFGKLIPNYFGSLDAMAEAEKILTPEQEEGYVARLADAIMSDAYEDDEPRYNKSNLSSFDSTYRATAPQRAEAFLRTLGKWKDEAK